MMAKAPKAPDPVVNERTPAAVFDIPAGLLDSNLGLECNRTISPWALDRVLSHLGAHSVDIVDSVAVSNTGGYAELVRQGAQLMLYERI